MKESPLLSVIVPVYRTEAYLERCLDSLLEQTLDSMEILVVNDGSPGNVEELTQSFAERDSRIRYLENPANLGLFRTRVRGVLASKGKYIGFVDSDDHVSPDHFRSLVSAAERETADITAGRTVWEEKGSRFLLPLHGAMMPDRTLEGDELRRAFFAQEYRCYSWHTIWNKIYSRRLWEKCLPFFQSIDGHLVMGEDILFSTVLFLNAERMSVAAGDACFYVQRDNSATGQGTPDREKLYKNLQDIAEVFRLAREYAVSHDAEPSVMKSLESGGRYYGAMYDKQVTACTSEGGRKRFEPDLAKLGTAGADRLTSGYFESVRTEWNGKLCYLKEQIINSPCPVISFDIFDTLLTRPFADPGHLFRLLDDVYQKETGAAGRFSFFRTAAEEEARRIRGREHPGDQDVTLEEIYDQLRVQYGLPKNLLSGLMGLETELEYRFSGVRRTGAALLELALACGKRVILISDMYLNRSTLEGLLAANKIGGWKALYVSSEKRKRKASGDLFRIALKEERISPDQLLHIGDNWETDVEGSGRAGVSSIFLPRAIDAAAGRIQGCECGRFLSLYRDLYGRLADDGQHSLGFQCMQAMFAEAFFDDPYRSFAAGSDYNTDPAMLGYGPLGMHLLGICKWLEKQTAGSPAAPIWFCARDSLLILKAFTLYQEAEGLGHPLRYIQASRRALLPMMLQKEEDFYQLPIEHRGHSPQSILSLLDFCSRRELWKNRRKRLKAAGFSPDERFSDRASFEAFMRFYLRECYDSAKHREARSLAESYYSVLEDGDYFFDLGYSGRIPRAAAAAGKKKLQVLYIHRNQDACTGGDVHISCMYPYSPQVSGMLREWLLSDDSPGCTGFKRPEESDDARGPRGRAGRRVVPVFGQETPLTEEACMVRFMQKKALYFVSDFLRLFGKEKTIMDYSEWEVSMPFESFLRNHSPQDRRIFGNAVFEDRLYGNCRDIRIADFITARRRQLDVTEKREEPPKTVTNYEQLLPVLNQKNKLFRAAMILLGAPEVFTEKMKKNLGMPFQTEHRRLTAHKAAGNGAVQGDRKGGRSGCRKRNDV